MLRLASPAVVAQYFDANCTPGAPWGGGVTSVEWCFEVSA